MKYCPYCGASLMGGAASFALNAAKRSHHQRKSLNANHAPKKKRNGGNPPQKVPKCVESAKPDGSTRPNRERILWISIMMATMMM